MSAEFATNPASNLEVIFSMSDKTTPIIFVLSQGADPNEQIFSFAKKMNFQDKLH